MNFPPFKSSNGHTITLFGRLFFIATSASRKSLLHFVDVEGGIDSDYEGREYEWNVRCTCESHHFGTRACRHVAAVIEFLLAPLNLSEEDLQDAKDKVSLAVQLGSSIPESIIGIIREKQPDALRKKATPEDIEKPASRVKRVYHLDRSDRPKRLRVRLLPAEAN